MEHYIYHSPIGILTVRVNSGQICGLWMQGQKHYPKDIRIVSDTPESNTMHMVKQWLDDYFAGLAPTTYSLPLAPIGTPFQCTIWTQLYRIPYGSTVSYKELALTAGDMLGVPNMSAQAVGNAVGRNPISIIIPCHRVIGTKQQLTGYAGGIERKQWLLNHEQKSIHPK